MSSAEPAIELRPSVSQENRSPIDHQTNTITGSTSFCSFKYCLDRMESTVVRKKRRLNPQITVQNRVAERRDVIARPDLQLTNLSYRSDFPNKDVEMPSKEVLDLIHRVGTNQAKDHPEMYQTLLPSALLASGIVLQEYLLYLMKPVAEDMKRAAESADQIRKQLHEDKKELYAGEESDSSSESEFSSDEDEDTSDSISRSGDDESQLINEDKNSPK